MAGRTITFDDYLRLRGLFTLAIANYHEGRRLERAAAGVLGEPEEEYGGFGHVSDAIYDGTGDVDGLLRKMKITVDPAPELGEGD